MARRDDIAFTSGGQRIAAWLYHPATDDSARMPCVVMAHGFAGVKEARLDAFAERFAAAGLACLVFDYRHFGASGGEPRQLFDIGHQREDWRSALRYARSLASVDTRAIGLWSTSFGGGHALELAAVDPGSGPLCSTCRSWTRWRRAATRASSRRRSSSGADCATWRAW